MRTVLSYTGRAYGPCTRAVYVRVRTARVHGPCSRVLGTQYPSLRLVNAARVHGWSKDTLYACESGPWSPVVCTEPKHCHPWKLFHPQSARLAWKCLFTPLQSVVGHAPLPGHVLSRKSCLFAWESGPAPCAHPSPNPKRHLDRFSRSCTDHGRMSLYFTTGLPFPH